MATVGYEKYANPETGRPENGLVYKIDAEDVSALPFHESEMADRLYGMPLSADRPKGAPRKHMARNSLYRILYHQMSQTVGHGRPARPFEIIFGEWDTFIRTGGHIRKCMEF